MKNLYMQNNNGNQQLNYYDRWNQHKNYNNCIKTPITQHTKKLTSTISEQRNLKRSLGAMLTTALTVTAPNSPLKCSLRNKDRNHSSKKNCQNQKKHQQSNSEHLKDESPYKSLFTNSKNKRILSKSNNLKQKKNNFNTQQFMNLNIHRLDIMPQTLLKQQIQKMEYLNAQQLVENFPLSIKISQPQKQPKQTIIDKTGEQPQNIITSQNRYINQQNIEQNKSERLYKSVQNQLQQSATVEKIDEAIKEQSPQENKNNNMQTQQEKQFDQETIAFIHNKKKGLQLQDVCVSKKPSSSKVTLKDLCIQNHVKNSTKKLKNQYKEVVQSSRVTSWGMYDLQVSEAINSQKKYENELIQNFKKNLKYLKKHLKTKSSIHIQRLPPQQTQITNNQQAPELKFSKLLERFTFKTPLPSQHNFTKCFNSLKIYEQGARSKQFPKVK